MKRTIATVLVLAFLICISSAMAADPGSASNPLITKSYITDTYENEILTESKANVSDAMDVVFDNAVNSLASQTQTALLLTEGYSGYTLTKSFEELQVSSGNSVFMLTGGKFVLSSGRGTVTVNSGAVVDISTGEEVSTGSAIKSGHRYFCTESTDAAFNIEADAVCLADGYYKIDQTPALAPIELPFEDVSEKDWYYNAVSFVYDKELFSGTSANKFSPNTPMTRAMFVTVLYRLAGEPNVSGSSAFTDVQDSTQYYYKAVIWASSNKIVNGYPDNTFKPSLNITREQMALIMYNYAKYAGYSTSASGGTAISTFPDSGNVSSWALDAVKWAVSNKIINGSNGYIKPADSALRSHVAQIIKNFCEISAGM